MPVSQTLRPALIDKDHPTADQIRDLSASLPTEPEIDRILTRKLKNRTRGGFTWPSLEEISGGLLSLLTTELGARFGGVTELRWLSGGASKVQVYFELDWTDADGAPSHTPMVLRMDPAESIQETSRRREFELLTAFSGIVPAPAAYWLDDTAEHLPYPAMVTGFVTGVTKPTTGAAGVSGLKASLTPELRNSLGQQFVEILSTIHNHDVDDPRLRSFERAGDAHDVIVHHINSWDRIWQEDSDVPSPLVRLAFAWLRANIPTPDRLSVVHGDFRTGNYLFTEDDATISAILDWEGGHIGDRHEDLAYTLNRMFGSEGDDGEFLVSGLMPESEFLDRYTQVSGLSVDPETLRFWKIFNCLKTVIIAVAPHIGSPPTRRHTKTFWSRGSSAPRASCSTNCAHTSRRSTKCNSAHHCA